MGLWYESHRTVGRFLCRAEDAQEETSDKCVQLHICRQQERHWRNHQPVGFAPQLRIGDPAFSQDFRVTKVIRLKERGRLNVFGEVFSAFNIANLSGYSFTLDTKSANPATQVYNIGQPTQRVNQTFGSGGPRAFQLGARLSF